MSATVTPVWTILVCGRVGGHLVGPGEEGFDAAATQLDALADLPVRRLLRRGQEHRARRTEDPRRLVLGEFGEPGGLVHRVADHRVLQALLGADVPGDGLARRDADTEVGVAE